MSDLSGLDDICSTKDQPWICPECLEKGETHVVRLVQANVNQAVYICEGPTCTYPMEEGLDGMVFNRSALEIRPTARNLEALQLPTTLAQEDGFQFNHVSELMMIQLALQYFPQERKWREEFAATVSKLPPEKRELLNIVFPHMKKLLNMSELMIKFAKHLDPSIEKIIQEIKQYDYSV